MFQPEEILQEFVDTYKYVYYRHDKISKSFPFGHGYRTFANRFFGPNREHYLKTNRAYQKTWRERNKEKHRAQERARYWKIKDRRNTYGKAYVAAQKSRDPEKWRIKKLEYRLRYKEKQHAKRT